MNTEVLKKTISFLEELHASNDQHFATNLCEDPLFHYKQDQIVNLLTDLRRELVLNDSQEITFDDPRNNCYCVVIGITLLNFLMTILKIFTEFGK